MRMKSFALIARIIAFSHLVVSCAGTEAPQEEGNRKVYIEIKFKDHNTVEIMVINKSKGDVYIPEGFDNDHLDFYYVSEKGNDFPIVGSSKYRRIANGVIYDVSQMVLPAGRNTVYEIDIRKLHGLTAAAKKMWEDAQVSNRGILKVKVVVSGREIENEQAMGSRLRY